MTRLQLLEKAKPILFNSDMIRAILSGRKTVTRRTINPQPVSFFNCVMGEPKPVGENSYGAFMTDGAERYLQPSYLPGDILYVRETWSEPYADGEYRYAADYDSPQAIVKSRNSKMHLSKNLIRWKPSIHMPKKAARIFLLITDVHIERLQDISNAEAEAEGVLRRELNPHGCSCNWATEGCLERPCANRDAYESLCWTTPFSELWDCTVPKEKLRAFGWGANPWVWVYRFEKIQL